MKVPSFYNPERVGTLFYPDVAAISREAESAQLLPVSQDQFKILLLVIDMQVDFCHEGGTLFVPGAVGDVRRLIDFIYREMERISHITCSLDSHYPFQIFHSAWWQDTAGRHPDPFTIITFDDVKAKRWTPLFKESWSREYVENLQRYSKKQLIIWPYHVPIGGPGHALDPELWSAVFFHALARRSQPTWWTKGSIPQTEHYSILKPEIEVPEEPQGTLSVDFIQALESYDGLIIAGEAESHCILESAEDLVRAFQHQPDQLKKIVFLKDCMSPVAHPDVDFHELALQRFRKFEKMGLRFINSTEPLDWGGGS